MVHPPRPRLARELVETLVLALPLVVSQLSAVGMNAIDAVLAGHHGAATLGAVAIGASIWSLAMVVAIGVTMAVPPSVAQLDGAGRRDAIGPLFRQALWLAAGLGLLLWLALRTAVPLVRVIGIDPVLVDDVAGFLRAASWGAPALAAFFTLRGMSAGIGVTRPTMYFSLMALVALGPIAWVLLYGGFGIPALGATGIGAATAIVLWLEAIAFALYVLWHPVYADLALTARLEPPQWPAIRELLRIGVPMGVTVLMEAGLFIATTLTIGTLGASIVASHQVALNVASLFFMIPLGIAMATTVRVGNAAGRDDAAAVRLAGHAGVALTLGTQAISATLMLALPVTIASLYSSDAAVITLAAELLVLAALFQFPDGIQVVANGALRGLKDTRVPMFITTFAYWGVGMPVGWWLAFPRGMGAQGMWIGLIAGLGVAAVLLLLRFRRLSRLPQA
ncbi:MAG: MATE family efflux transporter [Lysobacteraceae bacterium]|nr:MAG: MATE family efflux transporter [Xanthomonadaceae bacterium]